MSKYLPFISGNGSNDKHEQTSGGIVEFQEEIPLEQILKDPKIQHQMIPSQHGKLVCLLVVPCFMIPGDLLHFFASFLEEILSIQVYRHHADPDKYLALLLMDSDVAAKRIIEEFHGETLSTLDPTVCHVYPVESISFNDSSTGINQLLFARYDSANPNKRRPSFEQIQRSFSPLCFPISRSSSFDDSKEMPGTPPDPSKVSNKNASRAVVSGQGSPSGASRSAGENVDVSGSGSGSDGNVAEEELCAVCLEPLCLVRPLAFTMCCNHTFHISCVSRLEGPRCPVCRFQHESTDEIMSECTVCGWQGQSSEDGSDANTDNRADGGVGLAMGVGSGMSSGDQGRDLWVCLVCGFVGCGRRCRFHIRRHYEEHLHAYAMNTDNRHVYDFAGDGYVHRLILHHGGDDSDNEAVEGENEVGGDRGRGRLAGLGLGLGLGANLVAGSAAPRTKLVEVMDPRAGAGSGGDQRPQRPPLTSQQEEALVNRKLESAAYQYNQLLTWQLGQQRLEYETRLRRMQHFIEEETFGLLRSTTSSTSSTSLSSGLGGGGDRARDRSRWREAVARLMAAERVKALRAVDQAKERLGEAKRELGDLDMLGKGLAENKVAWEAKAQAAEAKLADTDKSYRAWVSKLEKKVADLMEQLDSASPAPSAPSSSAPRITVTGATSTGSRHLT